MLQYNIDLNGKTILVTGAAGFIGSNTHPPTQAEVCRVVQVVQATNTHARVWLRDTLETMVVFSRRRKQREPVDLPALW